MKNENIKLSSIFNYFLATLIPLIISLVGTSIAARLITPKEFGRFNIILATSSLAAALFYYWFCQWILRNSYQLTEIKEHQSNWVTTFQLSIFINSILLTLGVISSLLLPKYILQITIIIILTIALGLQSILTTILQGKGCSYAYNKVLTISSLARWAMTLVIWLLIVKDYKSLLFGQLGCYLIAVSLGYLFIKPFATMNIGQAINRSAWIEAFRYGAPFIWWSVSMQLLRTVDKYLIQAFRGGSEVGLYSNIFNVGNAVVIIFTNPIILAITPQLFYHAKENLEIGKQIERDMSFALSSLMVISAPMLIWSIFYQKMAISVMLGSRYSNSSSSLFFIILGTILWQVAMLLQKRHEISKRTNIIKNSIIYALIVNIVMNVLLIRQFGVEGAAIAFSISTTIYLFALIYKSKEKLLIKINKTTILNILYSITISLPIVVIQYLCVKSNIVSIVTIALAALIYTLILYIRKEISLIYAIEAIKRTINRANR